MSDLVERLRDKVPMIWGDEGFMITDDDTVLATFKEAADELERLREALRYYADKSHWHVKYGDTYILVDEGRIARAALGEGKE